MLSFFSTRRNWDFHIPSLAGASVLPPPPLVRGGGPHWVGGKGVGESRFRRGDINCGTLYMDFVCYIIYFGKDEGCPNVVIMRLNPFTSRY
jgi:hypothetical protein